MSSHLAAVRYTLNAMVPELRRFKIETVQTFDNNNLHAMRGAAFWGLRGWSFSKLWTRDCAKVTWPRLHLRESEKEKCRGTYVRRRPWRLLELWCSCRASRGIRFFFRRFFVVVLRRIDKRLTSLKISYKM